MKPSCTGLSLVTRAGLMVITLRQSNNPPNEKVQTHQDRKRRNRWRAKSRVCPSFSLTSRGLFTSAGNGAYVRKGTILRVMVAGRPKVSFWPDGSTSPGNYGSLIFSNTFQLNFCMHFSFSWVGRLTTLLVLRPHSSVSKSKLYRPLGGSGII
jgi:hypothetical protein